MQKKAAWALASIAVSGLIFEGQGPAAAETPPAESQPAVTIPVTVDQCRDLSDTEVRDRIRDLASTSLKTELTGIDYAALVNEWWAKTDTSARIDREIDDAIAKVRADSSWVDRAYSTVSRSAAARYATAVADTTYNSAGFKAALDDLATGVAKDAGAQIEKAASRISNPIIACVRTALQSRYGAAVAQVFSQESEKSVAANGEAPPVKIDTSDLVLKNAASISGIVLVVTRRVIARIVQTISRRIAGLVASRIISSVAGLVGLALIAKDVYEAGEGVFPIIAERMKSEETKTLIKDEIGKSIAADVTEQAGAIAQETADRIYSVWLDFKQKYNRLLSLAEKNSAFAAFLKDRRFDQLNKLGQLVDIVTASEGENGVLKRLADGSLNKALLDLNDAGMAIATDEKSVEAALEWTALAGRELPRVVSLGLHRWLSPQNVSAEILKKLFTLDDKAAISRIAALDPEARQVILNLPLDQMRELTRRLTANQLAAFANYEQKLPPEAARGLLRAVLEDPGLMQDLASGGLERAILSSRDQSAALNMILHPDSSFISYGRIVKDIELVRSGAVGYRVFWQRYWLSVLFAGFLLFLLLAWLRRLIFGVRPAVIIRDQGGTRSR